MNDEHFTPHTSAEKLNYKNHHKIKVTYTSFNGLCGLGELFTCNLNFVISNSFKTLF